MSINDRIPVIAIVLNTTWNIYNYRLSLIQALAKKGYRVLAIAPEDKYVSVIKETGITFIPLKNLSRKGKNPLREAALIYELKRIYKKEKVDIALQFTIKPNIYGSLAARSLPTQTISTVTGLGYAFLQKGVLNQIVKRLYRKAFRHCDYVFFQNPDDRQVFLENKIVAVEKAGLVSGSGVDTEYFSPKYNTHNTNKNLVNFLYVGRLLYYKGVVELMRAIDLLEQKHHNFHFTLIARPDEGNPSAMPLAEFLVWANTKKTVTFVEKTDNVRSYYADCDVVVLPSYREGVPRVLLEAMAMAKPIVATNVAGSRETVADGINGFLAEVKNAEDLAAKLEKMLTIGTKNRTQMGLAGREIAVERFDERIVVKKYVEMVEKMTGELIY